MEEEKKKAYSEVVEILKLIDDEERLEKIPFEVIELIKRNSDPIYKPTISKEKPLEEQNLMDETYAILGWIANKYWGENLYETSKEDEIEQISENVVEEVKEEKVIRNAAVYNDIEPVALGEYMVGEAENLPILISDVKWYQKIKIQVIKFLKIIFRINKKTNKEGVSE